MCRCRGRHSRGDGRRVRPLCERSVSLLRGICEPRACVRIAACRERVNCWPSSCAGCELWAGSSAAPRNRERLQLARGSCRAPVNVNGGPLRRISFGSISETRPLHRQRATRSQISRSPCGPGTSQRLSPRRRDALDGLTPCCCERETSPSAGLQVKTEVLQRRGVRDVLRWSDWRPRASMLPGGQRVTVAVKAPVVHPASFSLPLACRSR